MADAPRFALYYAHDPMCSWCWGFAPNWRRVQAMLPDAVEVVPLLGGLAPDTEAPMPAAMQHHLQTTWRRIQDRIPGTEFNFDFWRTCKPRRSTWRACRAVIAARIQDPAMASPMVSAIQRAYYLEALNPSDAEVLIHLADRLGLDGQEFGTHLDAPACQAALDREMALCRRFGLTNFPSLALVTGDSGWPVEIDYTNPLMMVERIEAMLEVVAG